ncbi:MAG TPA: hypothetical protein VHI71_01010 [Actinomycetota bacterium]|nr:hypothetical protein [Actinomycetota bacterium]
MKPRWSRKYLAALAAALLTAAACSDPQGTQPENSLLGKSKQERDNENRGGGSKKGGQRGGKEDGGSAPVDAAPDIVVPSPGATGKPGLSGASKTETKRTATGTDPRNATVLITEPDPDAEKSGVAPEYADILSTKVEGLGANVRFTITFRGTLPQEMPDDKTYMVAGIGVTAPEGKKQGYAFGASADQSGWKAYGGGKDGGEYPGELTISGDTVVFTLPWSALEGPRPFEWYAQGSWFRSLAGTTHYSLDALPNDGPAKYPAG